MARRKLLLNLRGGISGTEESMWLRSGPISAWLTLWDQSPRRELWVLSRLHQGLPAAEDTAWSCSSSSSFCPGWNQSLHIPKYDSSNSLSSCLGPSPGISVAKFWAQVRHCWNQSRQLLLQRQDQIGRLLQSALSTLGPSWVTALSQTPKPLEVIVLGWVSGFLGLPKWRSGKEPSCQCRGFLDPWSRKIFWRRKWQSTPVFLPGKSNGQRSLAGYSPWGHKELDTTEHTRAYTHTHTRTHARTHTHTHTHISGFLGAKSLRAEGRQSRTVSALEAQCYPHPVPDEGRTEVRGVCYWNQGARAERASSSGSVQCPESCSQ